MYEEHNLEALPRVKAIVVRGFITRYYREESWESELVALPPGVMAEDADAVCHYREGEDGRFYEYYGWAPSTEEMPIYIDVSDHL